MENRISLPVQRIDAEFAAADANRDERTVPMTFYTGAKVLQFSWEKGTYQIALSMDPAHVRLSALKSGRAPFTLGHASSNDPMATIGIIKNPTIEGGKAKADVRFSSRPDVEPIYQDVLDGILANVSVGAAIRKMKETTQEGDKVKSFLATDWEPFAVALVGIGADADAHFAATEPQSVECEIEFAQVAMSATNLEKEGNMDTPETPVADANTPAPVAETNAASPEPPVVADFAHAVSIIQMCALAGLSARAAMAYLKPGATIESVRTELMEAQAADSGPEINSHSLPTEPGISANDKSADALLAVVEERGK